MTDESPDDTDDGAQTRREIVEAVFGESTPARAAQTDMTTVGSLNTHEVARLSLEQFETIEIDHDGETYAVVETDAGLALERVEADE